MPVEYFIRFQGKRYDVGTRFKFKYMGSVMEGTIESISHNIFYVRLTDGTDWRLSKVWPLENTIIEIIEPVYYEDPIVEYTFGISGGVCPTEGDVFIGWIWYIVIMVVGTIFNDRLMIWVFTSAVFFLWKNGFLGGKK